MKHPKTYQKNQRQNQQQEQAPQQAAPLNDEQRAAVFAQDDTVVVAGAGSGKTLVLASRVLFLLAKKSVPIEKILVLTFTKKATWEMHRRIYRFIARAVETRRFLDEELTGEQVDFLSAQIEKLDAASISTIDSFMFQIAQSAASHFGMVNGITICEPQTLAAEARDFARRFLFALSEQNAVLGRLLELHGFSNLVGGIFAPLLQRASAWHEPAFMNSSADAVIQNARDLLASGLEDARARFAELATFVEASGIRTKEKPSQSITKFLEQAMPANEQFFAGFDARAARSEQDYAEVLFPPVVSNKNIRELYGPVFKNLRAALDEALDAMKSSCATLANERWLRDCYACADGMLEEWSAHKAQRGLYSYADVAQFAARAMERVPSVREHFTRQFSHVIVDEVQDNAREQNIFLQDLRRARAESPQHFFFVGDPKQSIYKFRGADVQTFLDLTEAAENDAALGESAPTKKIMQKIALSYNYRSTRALTDFFNALFSKVFAPPEARPAVHPTAHPAAHLEGDGRALVSYSAQRHPSHDTPDAAAAGNNSGHPAVSCEFLDFSRMGQARENSASDENKTEPPEKTERKKNSAAAQIAYSSDEIEAFHVGRIVQQLLRGGAYAPREIAVLSRTAALFPHIQRVFLMLDIPCDIQNKETSLRHDAGFDFYSWCTLLLFPEDTAAYAAVLRGPVAAISDAGLVAALAQRTEGRKERKTENIISQLFDEACFSDAADARRAALMRRLYHEARDLMHRHEIQKLLDHFWLACGYRYVLLRDKKYHSFLRQYDILKSLVVRHEGRGLLHFCRALRDILFADRSTKKFSGEEELSVLEGAGGDSVQVMTIHKSKGLEFRAVVLCGVGKSGSQNATGSGCERIGGAQYVNFGLPSDPPYLLAGGTDAASSVSRAIKNARARDEDEEKRALYVACTRAREYLCITGKIPNAPAAKKQTNKEPEEAAETPADGAQEKAPKTYYEQLAALDIQHIAGVQYAVIDARDVADKLARATGPQQEAHGDARETMIKAMLQSEAEPAWKTREKELRVRFVSPSKFDDHQAEQAGADADEAAEKSGVLLPEFQTEAILKKQNLYGAFGTLCHAMLKHACSRAAALPSDAPEKYSGNFSENFSKNFSDLRLPVDLETDLLRLKSAAAAHEKNAPKNIQAKNTARPASGGGHDDEYQAVMREAARCAQGFLESELWNKRPAGCRVLVEQEIHAYDAHALTYLRGIIDLAFITPQECIIIDYKTSMRKNPADFAGQLSAYAAAMRQLLASAYPQWQSDARISLYVFYVRSAEAVLVAEDADAARTYGTPELSKEQALKKEPE